MYYVSDNLPPPNKYSFRLFFEFKKICNAYGSNRRVTLFGKRVLAKLVYSLYISLGWKIGKILFFVCKFETVIMADIKQMIVFYVPIIIMYSMV